MEDKNYSFYKRLKGHFKTITEHKLLVGKLCFKLGLYVQGFNHDWSKYSLTEFIPGVKYYQGDRSPIGKEKEVKGYSLGWLHHKGRNKHHFEYWIDREKEKLVFQEIPKHYIKEMVADRIAACMIYQKDKYTDASAIDYYYASQDENLMHPNSAKLLEKYLSWVKEYGLDKAFEMIKKD